MTTLGKATGLIFIAAFAVAITAQSPWCSAARGCAVLNRVAILTVEGIAAFWMAALIASLLLGLDKPPSS